MKKNTVLKGVITALAVFFMLLVFGRPEEAYAAQKDSATVTAEADIQLDEDHRIHVYADMYVEYECDEWGSVDSWVEFKEYLDTKDRY